MTKLSVGLKFFRARYCGWLALESLCRQEGIDFEWELIVAEEQGDLEMGKWAVRTYTERLRDVGCVDIKYIPLPERLPLTDKSALVGRQCADSSEVFVTFGADDYLSPNGLKLRYDAIYSEGFDWFGPTKTIFYDIPTEKIAVYHIPDRHGVVHGKAVKTSVARQLVGNEKFGAHDGWYFGECHRLTENKFTIYMGSEIDAPGEWRRGVCTNGFNQMSLYRSRYVSSDPPKYPFGVYRGSLEIPQDVREALVGMKVFLQLHRTRGIGKYNV